MKNLTRLLFSATLLASFLFLTSCEKDDTEPDNQAPTLEVGDDIIGMTGKTYPINVTLNTTDGNELTWTVIESPDDSSPEIKPVGKTSLSFKTDIAGLYKVEISASNSAGKSGTGILTLYIGGVLPSSIRNDVVYPDLFDNEDYPDYYAPGNVQVTAGVTLEPGVVIESGADVRLWFSSNGSYLNAEGTAAKNIIFRGMDKEKGSWKALHLASNNVNNKLDFVQILHAGSSKQNNQKTGLLLQSNTNTRASIKNTTITQSGGHGLYIDGNNGNITEFSNNNFSDNDGAPIRLGGESMYMLDKASVYENNGIQAIEVVDAVLRKTGTIPDAGLPYHFYSSLELRTAVTIEEGVTLLFSPDKRLWVTQDGAIIAVANTKAITFSGLSQTPGAWFGMEVASPSPQNKLDGVTISYGGNTGGLGANILMKGDSPGSQLTVINCHISDSQTWGIYARSGNAVLTQSNNTFSNNASGDLWQN